MKYVHTLSTGRQKRQADITLMFQYIFYARLKYFLHPVLKGSVIHVSKSRDIFLFFEEGVMSFCDFGKYTNNRHRATGEDKTDDH